MCLCRGGHSVLRFGLVSGFFKKFGSSKIGVDRFQEISGTEYFGSQLVRFDFGSNQTNRIFLPEAKITRKTYIFYSKFKQYFLYFEE